MVLSKVNFISQVHRNAKLKRLTFHLLSDIFFYIPGKKKKPWALCVTSLPGVDAFHQHTVRLLFLTVTQRGSPAKITSLIHSTERKWHRTQQCLGRLSLLCSALLGVNYSMGIIQAEIQLDPPRLQSIQALLSTVQWKSIISELCLWKE